MKLLTTYGMSSGGSFVRQSVGYPNPRWSLFSLRDRLDCSSVMASHTSPDVRGWSVLGVQIIPPSRCLLASCVLKKCLELGNERVAVWVYGRLGSLAIFVGHELGTGVKCKDVVVNVVRLQFTGISRSFVSMDMEIV